MRTGTSRTCLRRAFAAAFLAIGIAGPTSTLACDQAIGEWVWFVVGTGVGGMTSLDAGGTGSFRPSPVEDVMLTAEWACDDSQQQVTVNWSHGFTDSVKILDGGWLMDGKSSVGTRIFAVRIGGTPGGSSGDDATGDGASGDDASKDQTSDTEKPSLVTE